MTQPTLACESVESVVSYPKTNVDAIRGVQEVSQRRLRGELNPPGGGGPLHMKCSRDAAISRIPAPHLLKQGQLQLAGASFRD